MEVVGNKCVVYEFGKFILDPKERTLFADGLPIHLPAKEFDTLLMLVEHNGRALSKEEMMSALWSDAFVEESNLAKQISRLRKLLSNGSGEIIETIPKHGYRFKVEDLRLRESEVIEPLILEKRTVKRVRISIPEVTDQAFPERLALGPHKKVLTPIRIFLVAVIASLAIGVVWYFTLRQQPATSPQIIAVLPLKSLADDETNRVLAAGLTDSLMTKLGGLKPLIIRPASSVANFTESGVDPAEVGRRLNANAVLDGSVLRSEGKLRVQLRLIDSATGEQLWTDKFDGANSDVFDLEDRLSEYVARKLLPNFSDQRITRRYTENAEAYDDYLKGRFFLGKRNEEGFAQAIDYFNDAIEKDPNYSLPYAGLADCYTLQGVWGTLAPNDVFPRAKQAAETAVKLDPLSAEPVVSLAFVEWVNSWDFARADEHFRQAIELNPNYPTAHHWYSYFLVSTGRSEEAIAEIKKARELEGPLTISVNTDLGEIYSWAGRYDEAEPYFLEVLKIEPNYAIGRHVHGINLIMLNRLPDAISELEKARSIEVSPRVLSVLSYAYGRVGDQTKSHEILSELNELAKKRYVSPFSIAVAYLGSGDTDKALDLFEAAYKERSDTMAILKVYPLLEPLRKEPRFVELLKRSGYSAQN